MNAGRSSEKVPTTITPLFEIPPFVETTNLNHNLSNICQMKTNHNEAGNQITTANYLWIPAETSCLILTFTDIKTSSCYAKFKEVCNKRKAPQKESASDCCRIFKFRSNLVRFSSLKILAAEIDRDQWRSKRGQGGSRPPRLRRNVCRKIQVI